MPDYKSMYFRLYGICCDVLENLKTATLETETMAMDETDPVTFPTSDLPPNDNPAD